MFSYLFTIYTNITFFGFQEAPILDLIAWVFFESILMTNFCFIDNLLGYWLYSINIFYNAVVVGLEEIAIGAILIGEQPVHP